MNGRPLSGPSPSDRPRVIVVGGGVSGCSCALMLAELQVPVTLLTSSMDVIGLPRYEPVVGARIEDGWAEIIDAYLDISPWLAWAWLGEAKVAETLPPIISFDRRLVSLRTKWVLENQPYIQLRQGLAVRISTVERNGGTRVQVETAFGEVFEMGACVLAVGLGLGGRSYQHGQELAVGPYREVPSDGLLNSLSAAGSTLHPASRLFPARFALADSSHSVDPGLAALDLVRMEAGSTGVTARVERLAPLLGSEPLEEIVQVVEKVETQAAKWRNEIGRVNHYGADDLAMPPSLSRASPSCIEEDSHAVRESRLGGRCDDARLDQWPPSPYADPDLGSGRDLALILAEERPLSRRDEMPGPWVRHGELQGIFPDGLASGEWYVSPGLDRAARRSKAFRETRAAEEVRAFLMDDDALGGPVPGMPGVWTAGQVSGAGSYLASLTAGSRVARLLAASMRLATLRR